MREIPKQEIIEAIRNLCIEANAKLPDSRLSAMRRALDEEDSPLGREVLEILFEMGGGVRVLDGELGGATNNGARRGYGGRHLRKPIVKSPIDRTKNIDNILA